MFKRLAVRVLLLPFLLCIPFIAQAEDAVDLLTVLPQKRSAEALPKHLKSEVPVSLNRSVIGNGQVLRIPFGKRVLRAVPDSEPRALLTRASKRVTQTSKGTLVDDNGNQGHYTISYTVSPSGRSAAFGHFELNSGDVFSLQHKEDGSYVLQELDQAGFPECPVEAHKRLNFSEHTKAHAIAQNELNADTPPVIDILVAYTPNARKNEGGTDAMLAKIDTAIALVNSTYESSGVNLQVRLVHTVEVAHNAVGFSQDLRDLTSTTDARFNEVHDLKTEYGVDLTVLIREKGEYCGIAWYPSTRDRLDTGLYESSVVSQDCISYHSFTHEIGHNQGLSHDRANGSSTTITGASYGHHWDSNRSRSVMAYYPGTRRAYISNPDVEHDGHATGVADWADNAATLAITGSVVAGFRESVVETPGGGTGSGGGEEGSTPESQTIVLESFTNEAQEGYYDLVATVRGEESGDPVQGAYVTLLEQYGTGPRAIVSILTTLSTDVAGQISVTIKPRTGTSIYTAVLNEDQVSNQEKIRIKKKKSDKKKKKKKGKRKSKKKKSKKKKGKKKKRRS